MPSLAGGAAVKPMKSHADLLLWLPSACQATLPQGSLGTAPFTHPCKSMPAQRYYNHASTKTK